MDDALITQIQNETDYFSKAKLLKYIIYDKQLRIIDLSKRLNIKPSYICHLLRLNKIDPMIIDGYYAKLISISHLFVISRLKTKEAMMVVYEKILSKNLTVLQAEEEVREILYQVKTTGLSIDKKEKSKIASLLVDKNQNVKVYLLQTRVRAKILIEIKGDLAETTQYLRSFISRIKPQVAEETSFVVEEKKDSL